MNIGNRGREENEVPFPSTTKDYKNTSEYIHHIPSKMLPSFPLQLELRNRKIPTSGKYILNPMPSLVSRQLKIYSPSMII
jgi:hypothetical protein